MFRLILTLGTLLFGCAETYVDSRANKKSDGNSKAFPVQVFSNGFGLTAAGFTITNINVFLTGCDIGRQVDPEDSVIFAPESCVTLEYRSVVLTVGDEEMTVAVNEEFVDASGVEWTFSTGTDDTAAITPKFEVENGEEKFTIINKKFNVGIEVKEGAVAICDKDDPYDVVINESQVKISLKPPVNGFPEGITLSTDGATDNFPAVNISANNHRFSFSLSTSGPGVYKSIFISALSGGFCKATFSFTIQEPTKEIDGGEWLAFSGPDSLTQGIDSHSLVYDKNSNQLLMYGGRIKASQNVYTDKLYSYNLATANWSTKNPSGSVRRSHQAFMCDGQMFVWGGADASSNFNQQTLQIYNPATDTWSTSSMSGASQGGAACLNGKVAVCDGAGGKVKVYSRATNKWGSFPAVALGRQARASAVAGKLFCWGGFDSDYKGITKGFLWDPEKPNEANAVATEGAPVGRIGHQQVSVGNKVYLFGGRSGSYTYPSGAYSYDITSDSWAALPTRGSLGGRASFAMVAMKDSFLIWAGGPGAGRMNDGATFDIANNKWVPMSSENSPDERITPAAALTDDGVYIFGGYKQGLLNSGALFKP